MNQLLDPAILFFCFGIAAGLLRSNLEIPPAIARFLSLYLLMALGLKGGFALARSGLTPEVAASLAAAVLLAVAVPLASYALLRRSLNGFDAAANRLNKATGTKEEYCRPQWEKYLATDFSRIASNAMGS